MEIAVISTREVIYSAPTQKMGRIKVTLVMCQNIGGWNLHVKYFGVEKIQENRTVSKEIGIDENGLPIHADSTESFNYNVFNLILEKTLIKSDEELKQLFLFIGKDIRADEFPQKFYEIQKEAMLMYVKNDFIDGENCIFGIKPEEWEIYNEE